MSNHDLTAQIATILTPLIGQNMARASVTIHCQRQGIDPGRMNAEELAKLARLLGQGLVCFVGQERAEAVAATITALPLER